MARRPSGHRSGTGRVASGLTRHCSGQLGSQLERRCHTTLLQRLDQRGRVTVFLVAVAQSPTGSIAAGEDGSISVQELLQMEAAEMEAAVDKDFNELVLLQGGAACRCVL